MNQCRHLRSVVASSVAAFGLLTSSQAGTYVNDFTSSTLDRTKFVREPDIPFSLASDSLKIRCAIADYILNSEEGSLEERVLEFVATVPLDV